MAISDLPEQQQNALPFIYLFYYVICLLTGLSLAYARGLVTEDLETILALHVDRSVGAVMRIEYTILHMNAILTLHLCAHGFCEFGKFAYN